MKKYIWTYRKFKNWEVCIIDSYDYDFEIFFLYSSENLYDLTHQELIEDTIPASLLDIVKFRFQILHKKNYNIKHEYYSKLKGIHVNKH